MNTTLEELAVEGRRVTFTYHRDRNLPDGYAWPGIITGTEPGLSGKPQALIRLDGRRSTLSIPVDYEGITYLDEVVPVPDLPMGRFQPVADDRNGFYEKAGVLVAAIGEDGEDLVIVTDDQTAARAAAYAFSDQMGLGLESVDCVDFEVMRPCWAVFEWEPEDAECPWTVNWDGVREGDEKAVRIYYLPA